MKHPVARTLLVDSGLIVGTVSAVACFTVFGYRLAGKACDLGGVAIATLVVVAALVPPLWLEFFKVRAVVAPLATVAWRLGILLPAVLWNTYQLEPARNCVEVTLLACYLMTLPLESWLLIRQPRP